MKGEKGITPVTVSEGLGEELTDDSFSKCNLFHSYSLYILVSCSENLQSKHTALFSCLFIAFGVLKGLHNELKLLL